MPTHAANPQRSADIRELRRSARQDSDGSGGNREREKAGRWTPGACRCRRCPPGRIAGTARAPAITRVRQSQPSRLSAAAAELGGKLARTWWKGDTVRTTGERSELAAVRLGEGGEGVTEAEPERVHERRARHLRLRPRPHHGGSRQRSGGKAGGGRERERTISLAMAGVMPCSTIVGKKCSGSPRRIVGSCGRMRRR